MSGPHGWTAWQLAGAVRRGELSALAVTQAALARVAAVDPAIGAWLRPAPAQALAAAAAIDAARGRGEPLGPLAGVPVGLKDNFVAAELETTAGSRILQGWLPPEDGLHAARLRAAGAVILGKLALDELGMGASGEHTPFGPVHNPWARGFVPGGSSSGPAAAVASRTACVALGSDTGGSIRQPAALCGLLGLKPSHGRVSRRGLVAFASSLDQAGPITRDVRDAALVLGCLSGQDPGDSTSLAAPVPDYLAAVRRGQDEGLVGVRVGVLTGPGIASLDPEPRACFERALAELKAAGATLVAVALPHLELAAPTYWAVACAEAASNLARYDGLRYGRHVPGDSLEDSLARTRAAGFGAEVQRRVLLGTLLLGDAARLERAMRARTLVARDHAQAFTECDVIATPTTCGPARRIGAAEDLAARLREDFLLVGANLAGLPAISVPAGFCAARADRPRLPVGLHLIAPRLAEPTLLRVAAAHEARTDWHREVAPGAQG